MTKNQREEKAGNIQRKRRRTHPSLPLDLTTEILLKLPAKSVVRFGCVSKKWSSITTSPYFTNSYDTRSPTRPSLLLCCRNRKGNKLFVFSISQHESGTSKAFDIYHMRIRKAHNFFSPTESVHGLICFQTYKNLIVWNPNIRTFSTLLKPENWYPPFQDSYLIRVRVILGYDPIEGKHKVVCFPRCGIYGECRVWTLGSAKETWRTVKTNHTHRHCRYGRCINGIVYYKAYNEKNDRIIMSFDVRTEKFDMIKFAPEYKSGILINYEGKLASVNSTSRGGIKMWILEDAVKHDWSYKYFSALKKRDDKRLSLFLRLKGCTDAGEIIYVPTTSLETSYVLYFDLKRKTFRKVEFEGVKSRNYEKIGRMSLSELHVIPNHNDSMMSFVEALPFSSL